MAQTVSKSKFKPKTLEYLRKVEEYPWAWLTGRRFIPLTATFGVRAVHLEPFHSDPADRMIIATTGHYGGTLVTKDERIRKFRKVRTLW
jgi:PIN domain nuclease of toxin-antitoxin system